MIKRIDHVALAVRDYEKALLFFRKLFGAVLGASNEDPGMKYIWQLMSVGDLSRLEILTPTGRGSFLDNFLEKKDGGVHHITFQTADIRKAAMILEKNGIPFFGLREYGNVWKELFIHPRNAFGVLIQIAEFNPPDWLDPSVNMPGGKKFSVEKNPGGIAVTFAHQGGGRASLDLTEKEAAEFIDELKSKL